MGLRKRWERRRKVGVAARVLARQEEVANWVLRAGALSYGGDTYDVLLPYIYSRNHTERKQPKYPHFVKNEEYFRRLRLPRAAQSWALVVIGRFSPRFLGLMRRQWEEGDVAYEEISLATTCLATPPCRVTSFNKATRGRVSPY